MLQVLLFTGECGRDVQELEVVELLLTLLRGRDPESLLLVVVEIRGVSGRLHLWYERRLNLSLIHGYPLGCLEPLMIFDVVHSIPQVPVPLGQVDLQ